MGSMSVREIADGLWQWTAPHPAWTPESQGWDRDVAGTSWESPGGDAILLVDPIVPAVGEADRDRFFRELDRDVERVSGRSGHGFGSGGGNVTVLVLNESHGRSAREVADRYSAPVLAARAGAQALSFRVDAPFDGVRELPGGARAIVIAGLSPGETVAWLPGSGSRPGALVFGDALVGADGGVKLACDVWPPEDPSARPAFTDAIVRSLRPLLELDFDVVLPSHGPPVTTGGRQALARALER